MQAQPLRYAVEAVGPTRDPVMTLGGLWVLPQAALDELEPEHTDMLILPGGVTWFQGQNTEAVDKALAFLAAGTPVSAISGATVGLARGGLLDDRRHTSNSLEQLQRLGYGGAAHYVKAPAVTDGDLITANSLAPIEFAREIFRRLEVYVPEVLEVWYAYFKSEGMSGPPEID